MGRARVTASAPPPAPARASVKYVRPLAVKIRAAWRAFGRCAHLFFVVRMTSRPALPLSPCHARLPRSKRVKMWLRLGFAEMLPSFCRPLGPSLRGPLPTQMPRWKSLLFLSAILFRSSRFSFKILSQKIPSTAASARFVVWSVAHSQHAYLPPFEKVGVLTG